VSCTPRRWAASGGHRRGPGFISRTVHSSPLMVIHHLSVDMHPADGRQVVVTDGDLGAIPAELRAEVHEKLLDLYSTVASVVPATAKQR